MEEGVDYTIKRSGNSISGQVYYTITGIGNYTGTTSLSYEIVAPNIEECVIVVGDEELVYNKEYQHPSIKLTYDGFEFVEGQSYQIDNAWGYYDEEAGEWVNINGGKSGDCKIRISPTGNAKYPALAGEKIIEFKIASATMEESKLKFDSTSYPYCGYEIKPSLYYEDEYLVEGEDYTAVYHNNVEVGMATVDISMIKKYTGSVQKTFNITKREMYQCYVEKYVDGQLKLDYNSLEFDAKKHKLEIKVYSDDFQKALLVEGVDYEIAEEGGNGYTDSHYFIIKGKGNYCGETICGYNIQIPHIEDCTVDVKNSTFVYDGHAHVPEIRISCKGLEFENYTVEYWYKDDEGKTQYFDGSKVGKNRVTIRNKDDNSKASFKGEIEIPYEIQPCNLADCEVTMPTEKQVYRGQEVKPVPTIKNGDLNLYAYAWSQDYTLEYRNNNAAGKASVTIIGKNNYTGSVTKEFDIYPSIQTCSISLSSTNYTYDGTEHKPVVTVKDSSKVLVNGTDYKLEYSPAVEAGEVSVSVIGMGNYQDSKTETYTISPIDITTADYNVSESIFSYDGSSKKPAITVSYKGAVLVADRDYVLTYTNNINPGTAYAVVTGIGNYAGQVSLNFTILEYNAGMDSVYDKGDTLISNEAVYLITDDEDYEVEYSSVTNKKITKLVIPATITCDGITYKVTSIGNKAFYKNTKIKSVSIGNNVKSIEDYAFYGCKNITSINMGKSVEVIGNSAFRKCTKLTSVKLPKSLNELGKNAFYGCSRLKKIVINSNSVIDVSDNAVKGISKKAVISVPAKQVKKYQKEFNKKTGFKSTMKIKKK